MLQTMSECMICFAMSKACRSVSWLFLNSFICHSTSLFLSMPMHLSERFSMEGSRKPFKISRWYWSSPFNMFLLCGHVSFMEMVLAFVSDYFISIHIISSWVVLNHIRLHNLKEDSIFFFIFFSWKGKNKNMTVFWEHGNIPACVLGTDTFNKFHAPWKFTGVVQTKTPSEIVLSEVLSQSWNFKKNHVTLQLILSSVPGNCCVVTYTTGWSIKVEREIWFLINSIADRKSVV